MKGPTNAQIVNDGILTIQKNGTTVQTFTANQSSNATANITVPTKASSEYAQHNNYWRMDIASDWVAIYTNNTDNIMVGVLTYYASGNTGVMDFIIGSGSYVQSINLFDFNSHAMPLVIPPHSSFVYKSTCFINAWATLCEVKLV